MRKSSSFLALAAMAALAGGNAWSQSSTATASHTPAAPTPSTQSSASPAAGTGAALATEQDKISYAIGMNIGMHLRHQPLDLNPKLFEQGLNDALTGKPTVLTPDQAKTVLADAQREFQQKEEEKMQAQAASDKKAGEAFLAANKTKPGVVTLPDGLQYKVLRAGTGPKPKATDTVVCNYKGTLVDGTEFDSSYKRGEPVTVPVAHLIKGWTEALQLMPVGSKWRLFIPADLAYGDRAAGPTIGPDSTVIFDVELVSIEAPHAGTSAAPAAPTKE